jgi:hypothetical protein
MEIQTKKPGNPNKNHGNPNKKAGNPNKNSIIFLFGFRDFFV